MTGYVFYDTETTGTDTAFDQILQFGAIRTDEELNELDRFDIRCRLMPHVVPAPKALEVTGITPNMLVDLALLSHYEAMLQIHTKLTDWSPAVFVGFNSISFDEPLLRQAFYQTLQSIYLTNTNDNIRADVLRLMHATSVYTPNAVSVPIGDNGRQTFRLDQLSPANGFDHSAAHEAMADVEATIYMAKLVKDRAPKVWDVMMRLTRKQDVSNFLHEQEIVCLTEFYGARPYSWLVTPCGANPNYDAEIAVFDLANEPNEYVDLGVDELVEILNRRPKTIRVVRANAQPILMPRDMAPANLTENQPTEAEIERRAVTIRTNRDFQEKVGKAMAKRYPEKEASPYVERQIYDGFVSFSDQAIMEKFHKTDWAARPQLTETLSDERMKRLAYRLIYLEKRDVLPEHMILSFDNRIADRMLTDASDVPWRTIPKAIQETEDLLSNSSGGDEREFYMKVRQFLENRGRSTSV